VSSIESFHDLDPQHHIAAGRPSTHPKSRLFSTRARRSASANAGHVEQDSSCYRSFRRNAPYLDDSLSTRETALCATDQNQLTCNGSTSTSKMPPNEHEPRRDRAKSPDKRPLIERAPCCFPTTTVTRRPLTSVFCDTVVNTTFRGIRLRPRATQVGRT